MDFGLNIVDTAPGYEDGYSEAIVGAALRGRRQPRRDTPRLAVPRRHANGVNAPLLLLYPQRPRIHVAEPAAR